MYRKSGWPAAPQAPRLTLGGSRPQTPRSRGRSPLNRAGGLRAAAPHTLRTCARFHVPTKMVPMRPRKGWHIKECSWDPRSTARTHRKSVVEGGPSAGNRRQNVQPRFHKIFMYVCAFYWALNKTRLNHTQRTRHGTHQRVSGCFCVGLAEPPLG